MKLVKNTQILIFSKIDGKFVVPVGAICEKKWFKFCIPKSKKWYSGLF